MRSSPLRRFPPSAGDRVASSWSSLLLCVALLPAAPAQGLGVFEDRARLAFARHEVGAAALDGMVYVAGGGGPTQLHASVERLDPVANVWTRVADLPTNRHHFGMAAAGGRLYVVGGYVDFTEVASVLAYDPTTNTWSPRAPLPRPRAALVAVEIGGKVYAAGGVTPGIGAVGDLTVYDPAAGRWTALPSMPTAREHLPAAAIDGKLYVPGGTWGGGLAVLEVFDPLANTWTRKRDMPTPRGGCGGAALFGRLLVFGGERPIMFPQVEEYDPASDTWRTLTPMTTPLHGIYPVVVGDEVIIPGGGTTIGGGGTDLTLAFHYERPLTACRVTPASVPRTGTFTYEVAFANLGRPRPVDLYLGYADASGGVFALYRPDLTLAPSPPLLPSFAGLILPDRFVIPFVPLASHLGSVLGPGSHQGLVALTAAGAFLDGRIDPGDLLSISFHPVTVR